MRLVNRLFAITVRDREVGGSNPPAPTKASFNEEDKVDFPYQPHSFLFDDRIDRSRKERHNHQIKKKSGGFFYPQAISTISQPILGIRRPDG